MSVLSKLMNSLYYFTASIVLTKLLVLMSSFSIASPRSLKAVAGVRSGNLNSKTIKTSVMARITTDEDEGVS